MKVVFLLNSIYPYYTGGRETWLYHICNCLCDRYDIYVYSEMNYSPKNNFGEFDDIDSRVKLFSIKNLMNIPFIRPFIKSYMRWINQEISARRMFRAIRKEIDSHNKEQYVVITMDTVFMGKVGRKIKNCCENVQYISSVRGPHAEISGKNYPVLKKYFLRTEKKNLDFADKIWANGWDTKELLAKKGYNSVVIKNGLDISRVAKRYNEENNLLPLADDNNIITIGTLIDIKGYIELIEALAIVRKKYALEINLVSLGKGNPKRYQALAESLDVGKFVNFIGEQRETIEYAKRFDLAACLSGGSGLSMACLESMASKTPVIAWDSPVYRQMIKHKESGYLIEEKNIQQLADGIYFMLSNKEEAKKMGLKAYEFAKQFDWKFVIDSIVKQIEKKVSIGVND